MRNTLGKLLAIFATLVLLFSAAFFTVSLILRDSDSIEKKFKELNVSAETGVNTPDLSRATTALLDYMRGERADIKIYADVKKADGTVEKEVELFSPEKEKIHMTEVQELWLSLEWFVKYGAIGAGVAMLFGFLLMEHGKRRALLSSALLWGCGVFGGVLAFLGVWAVLDFSSFWTVFHFIIFPRTLFQYISAGSTPAAMNELNWVLDADSYMIRILTPIFPSLVIRCALCVVLEVGVTTLVAIFIHFAWRKQGKPSPVADVVVIERDANEPVPIKGPDLVLAHKLRNAPKSRREEILRRAKNGEPLEDDPAPLELKPIVLPGQGDEADETEEKEHLISRLSATASPQGEASDADQKPSPRGEGVERSETDEVSDPGAANGAMPAENYAGAEEQRLTEGEGTTPQSRRASTAPLAQGSQGRAEASTAPLAQGSQGRAEAEPDTPEEDA